MADDDAGGRVTCKCASIPFRFEPHRERAADAAIVARYTATSGDTEQDKAASIHTRLSRHESGHAIAAVAFKKTVHHLTIGGASPHLAYELFSGAAGVDALALITAAGYVAEGSPAPSWGDMRAALHRAREKSSGFCDTCKLFNLAVSACPDRDGREIINTAYDTFDAAATLFASPEWSAALDALATALERETLLTGPAIVEIVAPYDLHKPLENLPAIWKQAA